MVVYIFLLLIICLIGCKKNIDGGWCVSKEQTTSIKGIFAIIIIFAHVRQYIVLSTNWLDASYNIILNQLGQLVVAPFLFYSGYGIMVSYDKNKMYFNHFPQNRILKTYLNFVLAVFFYFILSLILKTGYSCKQILLSFIGWESVGNSNWFVFSIIIAYFIVWLMYLLFKDKIKMIIGTFIGLIIFCLVMSFVKESYWYSTILCVPAGMLFAIYKDKIFNYFKKVKYSWIMAFVIMILLTILLRILTQIDVIYLVYNLFSIAFCLDIVLLTYKVKISNKILNFMGKYSFNIYILQRIPMLILSYLNIVKIPEIFLAISIVVTILISLLFEKLKNLLDKLITKKTY